MLFTATIFYTTKTTSRVKLLKNNNNNNIFSRVELLRSCGQHDNHQPVGKCGKVGSSLTFGQFCPLAYNHTLTLLCRPPITAAQLSLELEDICIPPLLNREYDSVVVSRTCCQKMLVDITFF